MITNSQRSGKRLVSKNFHIKSNDIFNFGNIPLVNFRDIKTGKKRINGILKTNFQGTSLNLKDNCQEFTFPKKQRIILEENSEKKLVTEGENRQTLINLNNKPSSNENYEILCGNHLEHNISQMNFLDPNGKNFISSPISFNIMSKKKRTVSKDYKKSKTTINIEKLKDLEKAINEKMKIHKNSRNSKLHLENNLSLQNMNEPQINNYINPNENLLVKYQNNSFNHQDNTFKLENIPNLKSPVISSHIENFTPQNIYKNTFNNKIEIPELKNSLIHNMNRNFALQQEQINADANFIKPPKSKEFNKIINFNLNADYSRLQNSLKAEDCQMNRTEKYFIDHRKENDKFIQGFPSLKSSNSYQMSPKRILQSPNNDDNKRKLIQSINEINTLNQNQDFNNNLKENHSRNFNFSTNHPEKRELTVSKIYIIKFHSILI